MKKTLIAGVVISLASFGPHAGAADLTAIQCGHVIDTVNQTSTENITLLISDTVITQQGPSLKIPKGAKVIDLSDSYCLPGLIDAHTHLANGSARPSSAGKTLMALRSAQKMLNLGFTTLRVPGDTDEYFGIIDLRDAINAGEFIGPRLFVAPHALSPLGGHGDDQRIPADAHVPVRKHVVEAGPENARQAVRRELKYGADWIKLYASGGVMSLNDDPNVQGFTDAEIHAFAEETHRYGKKITAHIHGDQAAQTAVSADFDSIEHGTLLSTETLRQMKQKDIFLVPTTYVLDWILEQGEAGGINPKMLKKAVEVTKIRDRVFREAYEIGVKMAFGVDQIFDHNISMREFSSLTRLGVSNGDALAMATVNGAELLGLKDQLGSLETGKIADIIAVPDNPLKNIKTMESVSFVMKDGQVIRRQD